MLFIYYVNRTRVVGTREIIQEAQKREKQTQTKKQKTYKKTNKNTTHGSLIAHNRLYTTSELGNQQDSAA